MRRSRLRSISRRDWIIHTVGPVWRGGNHGEAELLASCYRRSLEEADGLNVESIVFPSIATGVYSYPIEAACELAVAAVTGASTNVSTVRFVVFDEENERGVPRAVAQVIGKRTRRTPRVAAQLCRLQSG